MKRIGAFDAKTHFSRLLREVADGETVEILRNGHPVARLSPIVPQAIESKAAMRRLLSSKATLGKFTVKKLRDEGRRA